MACTAFVILVAMGGFGIGSSVSLPRTDSVAMEVVFALGELVVVVLAVVVAMLYQPDRPYRWNLLMLCTGCWTRSPPTG